MFDTTEFLEALLGTLLPSVLYAAAICFFDQQRPKILPLLLLFVAGAIIVAPCYMAEYALDIAFPWGSQNHLLANMLPSAILEEGAKLLCLALAFRMLLDRSDRWQHYFISGFVLGSGFMFMEKFVCMLEYGDIYMLQENRSYVVEMTDPLFGGIAGVGLFLILNRRWMLSSLFVLIPVALHFSHNAGIIVHGSVPWWPAYFVGYLSLLFVFAWGYMRGRADVESPAETTVLSVGGSLSFVRKV